MICDSVRFSRDMEYVLMWVRVENMCGTGECTHFIWTENTVRHCLWRKRFQNELKPPFTGEISAEAVDRFVRVKKGCGNPQGSKSVAALLKKNHPDSMKGTVR